MPTMFKAEVSSIGADAKEMFDAGVVIFFGEPCPDALAEVSVVHRVVVAPERDPHPGDVLRVGDSQCVIDQVGSLAAENLRTLGHLVVYSDPEADMDLLPGAIFATGKISVPAVGDQIDIFELEN